MDPTYDPNGPGPGPGVPTLLNPVAITIGAPIWSRRMPDVTDVAHRAITAALEVAHESVGDAPGSGPVEISLFLTDDETVRQLNARYRGVDAPTNVLSFSLDPEAAHGTGAAKKDRPPVVALGDIVLAFETVAHESETQAKKFSDHATHLIIHGVLHLLGHDHEREEDAVTMEGLEVAILGSLGISDPYQTDSDPGHCSGRRHG